MSTMTRAQEHPEEELWRQLKHVTAGMLGISGSTSHMQPMSHFEDRDNARLYFFAGRDSDLFKELKPGDKAHFCVIGKHQNYHACLMGDLRETKNPAKVDELWNDIVAAWFNGKD